jgi:hypothetical protein
MLRLNSEELIGTTIYDAIDEVNRCRYNRARFLDMMPRHCIVGARRFETV